MCYVRGIRSLHGLFTWRYAFALMRFALRVMPSWLSRYAYGATWLRGGKAPTGRAPG